MRPPPGVTAIAIALAAAACSRREATAHGPDASAATRVVSLGPSTTETLFAIGAGDRTVGRSRYCDYPPDALRLPAVGGLEPDLEAILALRPDLVVGPSGAWARRAAQSLADRGIASWFPEEVRSLADIDALVLALGDRTGTRAGAERVVGGMHARETAVDEAVKGEPRPRVLMVVSLAPVVAAGPAGFAGDMLRRAGSDNAVTDGVAWPVVGFERVVELDPDLILDATEVERPGPSRITPDAPGWSGVRAVREGHVVPIADERVLRPGPRVAEGLETLARAVHRGVVP